MKPSALVVLVLILNLVSGHSQGRPPGGSGQAGFSPMPPGSPQLSAAFSKLFGEHKAFSADVVVESQASSGNSSMPCKLLFLEGKSRMEIQLTSGKGSQIPPAMVEQAKAMGMGELVMIADEATGVSYMVYPGLRSYAELPRPEGKASAADLKVEITELGKESLNSHPCVKNKVLITDPKGKSTTAIVWNASDLKRFPVRIETADGKTTVRMNFNEVKFEKPDAKLFDPPAEFTRYETIQAMMQEVLVKRMLGGQKPGQ